MAGVRLGDHHYKSALYRFAPSGRQLPSRPMQNGGEAIRNHKRSFRPVLGGVLWKDIVCDDINRLVVKRGAEAAHTRQAGNVVEATLDELITAALRGRGRPNREASGPEEVDG